MAADCKSATQRVTEVRILLSAPVPWSSSGVLGPVLEFHRGNSSVGRASAFQAECRGFEPRFPLHPPVRRSPADGKAPAAFRTGGKVPSPHSSAVEHFLGKEEVTGSSPVVGSTFEKKFEGAFQ